MIKQKSILIVDDDKILSEAIQGLLEGHGNFVSYCDNGMDAVNLAQQRDYDMILTDFNMPGMTGVEVCRSIRHHRPDALIVGFSIESKEQDFVNAGANKFIFKEELVLTLLSYVN